MSQNISTGQPDGVTPFEFPSSFDKSLNKARMTYAVDLSIWKGGLIDEMTERKPLEKYIGVCTEASYLIEEQAGEAAPEARAQFISNEAEERADAVEAEFNGLETFIVKGVSMFGIGSVATFAAFGPPKFPQAAEAALALIAPWVLGSGVEHMRGGLHQVEMQPAQWPGAYDRHDRFGDLLRKQILKEEEQLSELFSQAVRSRKAAGAIAGATLAARLILWNKLPF